MFGSRNWFKNYNRFGMSGQLLNTLSISQTIGNKELYSMVQILTGLMLKPVSAKNTVISRNFLVWKFCGKAQFPHSFKRLARNYVETVPFHKISHQEITWNYSILRSGCTTRFNYGTFRQAVTRRCSFKKVFSFNQLMLTF